MTTHYNAYTVIGVQIPIDLICPQTIVPSCGHSTNDRLGKYCRECGIKVGTIQKRDDRYNDAFACARDVQTDAGVTVGVVNYYLKSGTGYFLGVVMSAPAESWAGSPHKMIDIPPVEWVHTVVHEFLAKIGCAHLKFALGDIKIHCYQYVSP